MVFGSTLLISATRGNVGRLRRQRAGSFVLRCRRAGNVFAAVDGLFAVRLVKRRVRQRDAILFDGELGHCVDGQVGHADRALGQQAVPVPLSVSVSVSIAISIPLSVPVRFPLAVAPGGRGERMRVAGAASGFRGAVGAVSVGLALRFGTTGPVAQAFVVDIDVGVTFLGRHFESPSGQVALRLG